MSFKPKNAMPGLPKRRPDYSAFDNAGIGPISGRRIGKRKSALRPADPPAPAPKRKPVRAGGR